VLTRGQFLVDGVALSAIGAVSASGLGPRRKAAISRLAERLDGRVLLPSSSGYDSARLVFNALYDGVRPFAIVQASSVADVARTIALAQHEGIPLIPRSGGHSFAGYSTGSGVVLDLSRMNRIVVAPSGTRARIGAGVKLIQLLTQLGKHHVAIPAGFCPTVGITGLALGGGIGRMTRTHGLTLDMLRRVHVVDARGSLLTADRDSHPDLFWASRGGGGGNFGIVTELEFDLPPIPRPVTRYSFAWPWSRRAQAFAAWQRWSIDAPREFQDALTFSTGGPRASTPSVGVDGVYLGPEQKAAAHLAKLQAAVGFAPIHRDVDVTDYVSAIKDLFCENVGVNRCALETQDGDVKRFGLSIKSTFVNGSWPAAAVDVIAQWLERRQSDSGMTRNPPRENLGKIWFDSVGGASAEVPSGATAYVHRTATFLVQYQSRWSVDAPEAVRNANLEWLRGFHGAMAEWNQGAYVNYTDPDLKDYLQQYYGANLDRLRAVKRAYDPHDFFRFPQSIPT
jgi:FAD/FMN-containing dehydrogenase